MQATYVKFKELHRERLQELARGRGCTLSDLVRQATIHFFNLPTDGPNWAIEEHESDGGASDYSAPVAIETVS